MKRPGLLDTIKTNLNWGGMFPDKQKIEDANNYYATTTKQHDPSSGLLSTVDVGKDNLKEQPKPGLFQSILTGVGEFINPKIASPLPTDNPAKPLTTPEPINPAPNSPPAVQASPQTKPKTTSLPNEINPTSPPDKGAEPYVDLINTSAKQYGIPVKILYNLLATESMRFNPQVISGEISSPVGAQGIAQFMPETAKGIGVDPLNPEEAIPASAKYLADKFKRHGSWKLALASYNAGSGNVEKYGGVPPFKETQDYVKRILGN